MKNSASHAKAERLRLSAAELKLWHDATRNVAPLRGAGFSRRAREHDDSERPDRIAAIQLPKGEKPEIAAKAPVNEELPKLRRPFAPIEPRLRQKLSRGQVAPDAVIDLHGMDQREAFLALRNFLSRAQRGGARLVLVVTGKGRSAAEGNFVPGILRRRVPDWLCGAEYRPVVAGFEEAARPHGGSGALYVRLKRCSRPSTGKSDS
jgi:DNA-nicking Smr family endonuclease